MKKLRVFLFVQCVAFPAWAEDQTLRYRGHYTLGHEVNIFCPEISSQCYWLSPRTREWERRSLRQLAEDNTNAAYAPVCVTVEGEINRDPTAKAAIGFAADYDGLFTVSRVYGLCNQPRVVTHGDLQHHRWVLESVNGETIDPTALHNVIPELEIGEQMMAFGNSGCNRFHGEAELRENRFIIARAATTRMLCQPAQNDLERQFLQVLGQESIISIDTGKGLTLETDDMQLKFRLEDRVR